MPPKMRLNTSPKFISFNLKTVSAAVLSALLVSNAFAAGLGKLTVLSSLGQPLNAEIELTAVSKDEAGSLVPKLASVDAFRQANIELNPALLTLRFAVDQRTGRQFIRVSSVQPINEPFVDMLLELGGGNGRLIREYTFLLDPADLRSSQSPQVAAPITPAARRSLEATPPAATQAIPTPQPAAPETPRSARPAAEKQSVRPVPVQASSAPIAATTSEYQVKRGDSLSKVAGQVKPEGVSLDQMLVALFRANPDAFVGDNMSRLKAGQILSIPDANTASGVSNAEAHGIVVAQAVDFSNYRNKLAGQVATAAPQKAAETKQSASGKIVAKVEEKATPANESKDKLKVTPAGGAASAPDKGSKIAAGTEDKIAKDKAIAEADARVKELEKNVSDLQKVLEVKNKDLADQQKQADSGKAGAKPAAPAAAPAAPAPAVASSAASAASVKPEVKPAPPAPAPMASAPIAKPKPKPVAPPPEPSFLGELLDNPSILPGGALLLAILGGLGFYTVRRKKKDKSFEDSIITDSSLKANSLFGSTGGQSVDTNNSVFNSNFAPSASQIDSNEVDPVAEADVYIAYGRDAQAEEILKEALRTQPDRNAVRVKLLEIYANRKDVRAFEILATELYSMTKGEGEDWMQAASLGIALDPANPLYAAGKAAGESGAGMTAPTQPLDEPDLDALLTHTTSATSLETLNTIEDSSSFGNSGLATEVHATKPEATPAGSTAPSDLDFDLEGLSTQKMDMPTTVARPPVDSPKLDFENIDFDFLQVKDAAKSADTVAAPAFRPEPEPEPALEPAPAPAATMEFTTEDFSSTLPEIPSMAERLPMAREVTAAAPSSMDFDLSGITLELNPSETKLASVSEISLDTSVDTIADIPMAQDDNGADYSNNAEMSTKLDLAVAYQEIGDKEGARELLDEVVKGGTQEQTDKAKYLLSKLA